MKRGKSYARAGVGVSVVQDSCLALQNHNIRRFAKENGVQLRPEDQVSEVGSGIDMNRPGLQELLESVRAGEVDVVVAYHPQYLSRRRKDLVYISDLCDEHGVELFFAGLRFGGVSGSFRMSGSSMSASTVANLARALEEHESAKSVARARKLGLNGRSVQRQRPRRRCGELEAPGHP